MKRVIIFSIFITAVSFSYAQTGPMQYDPAKAIQFNFGLGGAYNNYKNLNSTLKNANLPTLGKFSMASVAEVDLRHNNFLVGLISKMGFSPKRNDDYNTAVINFYGGANIGYYFVNSNKFHLAPQAGIGYFSSIAQITKKSGYSNFNDVLANRNSVNINQGIAAFDFALKFDFADFSKSKAGLLGARLGYTLGLSKRGWGVDEVSNSTVDNSPKDRINQFYAMAVIGFALQKPVKK